MAMKFLWLSMAAHKRSFEVSDLRIKIKLRALRNRIEEMSEALDGRPVAR